ncbi:hypothetical protein LY78DRAFT_187496 [Colletotrichum sublineola]|nr:hypothetical protein LY78DRAFT_187496 [Colletotrichum sublineola]
MSKRYLTRGGDSSDDQNPANITLWKLFPHGGGTRWGGGEMHNHFLASLARSWTATSHWETKKGTRIPRYPTNSPRPCSRVVAKLGLKRPPIKLQSGSARVAERDPLPFCGRFHRPAPLQRIWGRNRSVSLEYASLTIFVPQRAPKVGSLHLRFAFFESNQRNIAIADLGFPLSRPIPLVTTTPPPPPTQQHLKIRTQLKRMGVQGGWTAMPSTDRNN